MGLLDRLSPETRSLFEPSFLYFWALSEPPPPDAPPQPLVGSAALIPPLLATATGLVLDIGPGTGITIKHYTNSTTITKIFGAEPTVSLHPALSRSIAHAGLTDKYQIITADASAASILRGLEAAGQLTDAADSPQHGFDTIVCIRVLCSVPNQLQTIRDLHTLLKPGGKLMVVEHVVNPWRTSHGSVLGRLAQAVYMAIGWSYFIGDCEMTRDTERSLREAVGGGGEKGGWRDVRLRTHFGFGPFTYVEGSLTKA